MIDFTALNDIAARVTSGEFHFYLSIYRGSSGYETCRVSLEKGSTYGKFHMKVEGHGATPSEAFEAALRQFPPQPLSADVRWDTERLAGPTAPSGAAVEDAVFTETTTKE